MITEIEKPVTFDESCAQEVAPARPLAAAAQRGSQSRGALGRLERLDVLMWSLCFGLGVFFAKEVLPLLEPLASRF